MFRKSVFAILPFLLLVSTLTVAFNIQPVKAWTGTVYIRADGSVDPPTAPISTVDYVTYTLTGNITTDVDGIVVEKSNIIIDGNGYTVQRRRASVEARNGIYLYSINNVIIKNTSIEGFGCGVYLNSSNNNSIFGNNITNGSPAIGSIMLGDSSNNSIFGNNITNSYTPGIVLGGSSNNNSVSGNNITKSSPAITLGAPSSHNSIFGNNIAYNAWAIYISSSSGNKFYHNNFRENVMQVYLDGSSVNNWDDGYPSGGNYWSNYEGVDYKSGPNQDLSGSDGIGDTPYVIEGSINDRYPLMEMVDIPEFPSSLTLLLLMVLSMLAVVLIKIKLPRKPDT